MSGETKSAEATVYPFRGDHNAPSAEYLKGYKAGLDKMADAMSALVRRHEDQVRELKGRIKYLEEELDKDQGSFW